MQTILNQILNRNDYVLHNNAKKKIKSKAIE